MPYSVFHTAAEKVRYDIELLSARFGVGFETVCHRLSTLQRTGHRGVLFSFLRVDRAGNVSKRQSAAEIPDGKRYFWIARTIARGGFGHHARVPSSRSPSAANCAMRTGSSTPRASPSTIRVPPPPSG